MNPRRSFLSRFGLAAAAMTLGSGKASAEPPSAWQPARDAKDDWLDQIPGKHRLFFDTLTDGGLREARGFGRSRSSSNVLLGQPEDIIRQFVASVFVVPAPCKHAETAREERQ